MRPRMYSSAARSSKRRMSHMTSNISRMSPASGRGRGVAAGGHQPRLGGGEDASDCGRRSPPLARALQVELDDRHVAPAPLAPRVGAVGADHAESGAARQREPGRVLGQDHADELPVAVPGGRVARGPPASSARSPAPARDRPRRPCTRPRRRTSCGGRRGRARTTPPPRRRRARSTPARARLAQRARRGAPARCADRSRRSPARSPPPRRRWPRSRRHPRSGRGGSRAAGSRHESRRPLRAAARVSPGAL